jgi:hypothetical protein
LFHFLASLLSTHCQHETFPSLHVFRNTSFKSIPLQQVVTDSYNLMTKTCNIHRLPLGRLNKRSDGWYM